MLKQMLMCLIFIISSAPDLIAEDMPDEMVMVRRQAKEERHKESQIQLQRLELERLKLEAETRKTLSEMGRSDDLPLPGVSPRVIVEVRNIVIDPDGARASLEVGGICKSVKVGDMVGPFAVQKIGASEVALVDEKGSVTMAGLRL